MAKTPDNKPAAEPHFERTYTTQDLETFLTWIRNVSHYYPGGANGWGNRDFSPYMEVKPETILRDFNAFLDQRVKLKVQTPSKLQ